MSRNFFWRRDRSKAVQSGAGTGGPHLTATEERLISALGAARSQGRPCVDRSELRVILAICGGALAVVVGLVEAQLWRLTDRMDQLVNAHESIVPGREIAPPDRLSGAPYAAVVPLREFISACLRGGGTFQNATTTCILPEPEGELRGHALVVLDRPLP